MKKTLLFIICALLIVPLVYSLPQDELAFGIRYDINGALQTANVNVTGYIYTAVTGGTQLYNETRQVNFTDGVGTFDFVAMIQTFDWSQDMWVELQIAGEVPMIPRLKVRAVPDSITNPFTQNSTTVYEKNSSKVLLFESFLLSENITFRPLTEKNADIAGPAMGIYMIGPSGQNLPHFILSSGGDTQASVILRSVMIADEIAGFHNTSEATDCSAYMANISEELKIDCNTTTTGADLIVSDDLQVVGDVWIKNTDGDYRFMTRVLEIRDDVFDDILVNRLNVTISGLNLSL